MDVNVWIHQMILLFLVLICRIIKMQWEEKVYEWDHIVYKIFFLLRFSDSNWMIISLHDFCGWFWKQAVYSCSVIFFPGWRLIIFKLVKAVKKSKWRLRPCIWDENLDIVVPFDIYACYVLSCFKRVRFSS